MPCPLCKKSWGYNRGDSQNHFDLIYWIHWITSILILSTFISIWLVVFCCQFALILFYSLSSRGEMVRRFVIFLLLVVSNSFCNLLPVSNHCHVFIHNVSQKQTKDATTTKIFPVFFIDHEIYANRLSIREWHDRLDYPDPHRYTSGTPIENKQPGTGDDDLGPPSFFLRKTFVLNVFSNI